jgi:hypothetical protein
MTLPAPWRRALLLVHVTSAVGLVGAVAGFLALALAGAGGDIGVYGAMRVLTVEVIVPLAAASLVVGVASSLLTPWGLLRHYWVIAKLGLTAIAVLVLLLQLPTISGLAEAAARGSLAGDSGGQLAMIVHAGGGLVVLVLATLLSVYKPRGLTRRGLRAGAAG